MQLRMSSAYHPQSDSQTKVLNRVIEQCLRAFVHGRPQEWGKFLLWVEWSHNTSWIAATGTTPFKITFGCIPFNFPEYIAGSSTLDAVDKMLTNREETFQVIRKKLLRAQERMKLTANTKRREVTYQPGDWEMLKLHSYRQVSAKWAQATWGKLAKRFYRPFQVLERIGPVAYRLKLSKEAHIHSVFHCSLLKTFKGSPDCILKAELPSQFVQHQPIISLLALLDYRRSSKNAPWEVLVQCEGLPPDDTSWENWEQLCEDYHLEDKVNFQGPTDDTKEEEITSRGKKDIQTRM